MRHRRLRWYQRNAIPPPSEPVPPPGEPSEPAAPEEHSTPRAATGRALRLFVVAIMLVTIALVAAGLFFVREIQRLEDERVAGHNDRLQTEQQLRRDITEGLAKLRRDDQQQFADAICVFANQFKPGLSHSLDVLREQYGCPPYGHNGQPGPSTGASPSARDTPSVSATTTPAATPSVGQAGSPANGPGGAISPSVPGSRTARNASGVSNTHASTKPSRTTSTDPSASPTATRSSPPVVDVGGALCGLLGICLD